jgi:hypothetical protein
MNTLPTAFTLKTICTILITAFVISGCNPGESVTGIDDLDNQIPGMKLIDGAGNATIVVNKNRDFANFSVSVDGLLPEASSLAGDYIAWCSQYDISISSDNTVYEGAKLYNIENEGYWKNVVYTVNKADEYLTTDSTLIWSDIQVAVWAMINHRQIELSEAFISSLGSTYSGAKLENVNRIISDVESNINGFNFSEIENSVFYVELAEDVQDLIITRAK